MKQNNIKKIIDRKKEFFFSWMLFKHCNYNCSYCLEKNLIRDKKSIDELKKIADKIYYIYSKNLFKFDCLSLLGGEISLLNLEDFKYIFNNFNNIQDLKLEYITNFSADNNYYLELVKFFNIKEIILKLSLHTEFISIEDFFKKILLLNFLLQKNNINNVKIKIEYVLTKNNCKNIDKIISWYKKIKKINNKVELCFQEAYTPHYIKNNIYSWGDKYLYLNKKISTEYLNQKMSYEVEFTDGNVKNLKLDNVFNLKKIECLTNNIFLENNILTTNCCQNVLTNDFLNSDVNKINFELAKTAFFKCKRKICCRVFKEVRNIEN